MSSCAGSCHSTARASQNCSRRSSTRVTSCRTTCRRSARTSSARCWSWTPASERTLSRSSRTRGSPAGATRSLRSLCLCPRPRCWSLRSSGRWWSTWGTPQRLSSTLCLMTDTMTLRQRTTCCAQMRRISTGRRRKRKRRLRRWLLLLQRLRQNSQSLWSALRSWLTRKEALQFIQQRNHHYTDLNNNRNNNK